MRPNNCLLYLREHDLKLCLIGLTFAKEVLDAWLRTRMLDCRRNSCPACSVMLSLCVRLHAKTAAFCIDPGKPEECDSTTPALQPLASNLWSSPAKLLESLQEINHQELVGLLNHVKTISHPFSAIFGNIHWMQIYIDHLYFGD